MIVHIVLYDIVCLIVDLINCGGRRDRMVVGFTTSYVISVYHHYSCKFESHSW